jgi:hypothetical protein
MKEAKGTEARFRNVTETRKCGHDYTSKEI